MRVRFGSYRVTLVVCPMDMRCGFKRLNSICGQLLGIDLSKGQDLVVFVSKTCIRKNSSFSQSVEGIKRLCDCFTLFETAHLNGIDAEQWLRDYGRALFKYCYEKGWEEELAKGKNPEKKIMQWDFCRLQEGFDFDVWLP